MAVSVPDDLVDLHMVTRPVADDLVRVRVRVWVWVWVLGFGFGVGS